MLDYADHTQLLSLLSYRVISYQLISGLLPLHSTVHRLQVLPDCWVDHNMDNHDTDKTIDSQCLSSRVVVDQHTRPQVNTRLHSLVRLSIMYCVWALWWILMWGLCYYAVCLVTR